MNKIWRKGIGMLVAVSLLAGWFFSGKAVQVTASSAADLNQQYQDTVDKIEEIKNNITAVKNNVKKLESSKKNLQEYIDELDVQAEELNSQIQDVESQIARQEEKLAQTTVLIQEQQENMVIRIQYMYENGNASLLETVLTSNSISEMLTRVEYISQMSQYDREMLEEYVATTEQLVVEKEQLQLLSDGLSEQKDALDDVIASKTKQIKKYQAQIDKANKDAKAYQAQLLAQEKELEKVEDAIAAAAAAGGYEGSVTGFIWPCPASKRITSYFGPRKAPVEGASTDHKGIDIGVGTGNNVIASAAGKVTTSTYSKSAGNYIVISHGSGMSTVYMHNSKLLVSVGDYVEQGQTIALSGSTGYSSGPHLHFGVIKNGTYVDPLGYVSP